MNEHVIPAAADAAATGDALLRKAVVLTVCGLSEKGLHLRLAEGVFPKPVWLDARNPAWLASEIRAWIERLKHDRDHDIVTPKRAAYNDARRRGGLKAQAMKRGATGSEQAANTQQQE